MTSSIAQRMRALRPRVLAQWEQAVRAALDKARGLSQPILLDTLPGFYDNIAESLAPGLDRCSGVDGTTMAAEHGNERARVTAYDHEALIAEYQILRRTILEVMHAEGVALTAPQVMSINASIDSAIQEAVNAFSLVHAALRERFAAALAHDLRGPLGAASTALELILLSDDATKMKSFAGRALDNARRMNAMIDELLHAMAFHGGGQLVLALERVDILELAGEVRDDALAQGAAVEVAGVSITGWWDRQAIKRALENIVGNAVKYGADGAPIRIGIAETHGRLVLSVHNEGAPIPPEAQEGIFQMYRRADSAKLKRQHGWGIGLPYVRAVAESHGGSIVVDSTAVRGTTFVIDIPIDCRPLAGAPTVA